MARILLLFLVFHSFEILSQVNVSGPSSYVEDTTGHACFLEDFESNMRSMYQRYGDPGEYNKILSQLDEDVQQIPQFNADQYCERLLKMNQYSMIPFDCHPSVIQAIEDYGTRRRSTIRIALGRSKLYFELYEAMLDKYDLPIELKYLSVIESMLIPKAKSRAGALGLWQFMYGTGKMFGLAENSFIDERMDPIKATDAACRYLLKLNNIYNDWNLALAAYNAGPGNVNKAIRRANGKTTYWEIRPYLPRETQDYVPRFMAFAYLMEHADLHKIKPAEVEYTYYDLDTICLKKGVQMQRIETMINLPVETIKSLNPSYKTNYIPQTNPPQCISLPLEKIALFIEYEEDIYKSDEPFVNQAAQVADSISAVSDFAVAYEQRIRYHKVKKGETLATIAKKYNTSIEQIQKMNGRTNDHVLVGETIKIDYIKFPVMVSDTEVPQDSIVRIITPENRDSVFNEPKALRHTVKSGETIYGIAQLYKANVDKLMEWNNLKSTRLLVGQVLVIYVAKTDLESVNLEVAKSNAPPPPTKKFHTVRSGETMGTIAKKHGTTVAAIQKLNRGVNPNRLKVGQKIRVK